MLPGLKSEFEKRTEQRSKYLLAYTYPDAGELYVRTFTSFFQPGQCMGSIEYTHKEHADTEMRMAILVLADPS